MVYGLPPVRLLVVYVAVSELVPVRVPVPVVVAPLADVMVNVTVPVAMPILGKTAVTVAVKVTVGVRFAGVWSAGFGVARTIVLVLAWVTVSSTVVPEVVVRALPLLTPSVAAIVAEIVWLPARERRRGEGSHPSDDRPGGEGTPLS